MIFSRLGLSLAYETVPVDVDEVGFVAHGVGLDEVCHVGLVQHPDACDEGVVGDSDSADAVVPSSGNLSGASGAVAVEPVVGVAGVRVGVVAAEIIAGAGVLKKGQALNIQDLTGQMAFKAA